MGPGIEAHLFQRGRSGVIVFWKGEEISGSGNTQQASAPPTQSQPQSPPNLSATPTPDANSPATNLTATTLTATLGGSPILVDLLGHATPVITRAGVASVRVMEMPQILVDTDAALSLFRAAVAVDNPLLEARFEPHSRKLRLTNTFDQPVAGTVRLTSPPGWTITPRIINFSASPGQTVEHDIAIEFPYNYPAGPVEVTADFSIPGIDAPNFSMPMYLRLGLSDIGTRTLAFKEGPDLLVQQMITNYGSKPADYLSFAVCVGQPRQERLVTALPPGQTVTKRYRFKATPDIKEIRVGLRELDGPRILNDVVQVP